MSMKFMMDVAAIDRPDITMFGGYGGIHEKQLETVALNPRWAPLQLFWDDPWPDTAPFAATYGPPDDDHPAAGAHRMIALINRADLETAATHLIEDEGLSPAGVTALGGPSRGVLAAASGIRSGRALPSGTSSIGLGRQFTSKRAAIAVRKLWRSWSTLASHHGG